MPILNITKNGEYVMTNEKKLEVLEAFLFDVMHTLDLNGLFDHPTHLTKAVDIVMNKIRGLSHE